VLISNCAANGNGGDNIVAVQRCNVVGCVAGGSLTGNGINLSFLGNSASNCVTSGNFLNGIYAQQRCKVLDCTSKDNQQNGVRVNFVGTVSGCYCSSNQVCGIVCDSGGGIDIVNNQCSENGNATTLGAGIRVGVGICRIDGNMLAGNYRSLDVTGNSCIISHNVSSFVGAGGHYSIAAGNSFGPIVNVAGVGDISGTANANHPMANYTH
jgi:hypothetical protein